MLMKRSHATGVRSDNSATNANNKKRWQISDRFIKRFCDNTSIHGLKLIAQNGVPWFERQVFMNHS